MPLLDKPQKTVVYMAEEHKFSWNSLMSDSAGFVYKLRQFPGFPQSMKRQHVAGNWIGKIFNFQL